MRRAAREIILAAALTLVAIVLVLMALARATPETAAIIDPPGKVNTEQN